MNLSDYLLYSLLGLIIILLCIGVALLLKKQSPSQTHPEQVSKHPTEAEPTQPKRNGPHPDPIDNYLKYLRSTCHAVESLSNEGYLLLIRAWSLPVTLEIAKTTNYYGQHEDYQPTMKLYFQLDNEGHWEITDHGENAAVLDQITQHPQEKLNSFTKDLNNSKVLFNYSGVLQARGNSFQDFETSLKAVCDTVKAMDDRWSDMIWECTGPLPITLEQAAGDRHEFAGEDWTNNYRTQKTRSFSLRQGAMAIRFETEGKGSRNQETAVVQLVRDDPGTFDTELTIAELTGDASVTGVWRVAEGIWRDPHPGIKYHLEIKARGKWSCEILQPDLGKSKGTFPHRAGLQEGATIMGPFRTGSRPTNVRIDHSGMGLFYLQFVSIDGTHEPEVFVTEGQFHTEANQLDLLPGKEYLACADGHGHWQIELTEGY